MAKIKKIKLSISRPCSEDWNTMPPDEKGRFCAQCNKPVIDFSNYTNKELIEFFAQLKGAVCGRVCNTQLNQILVTSEPSNTPFFRKALFGTALAAGIAGTVQGQSNTPVNTTIAPTPADTDKKTIGKVKVAQDTTRKPAEVIVTEPIYKMGDIAPISIIQDMSEKGKKNKSDTATSKKR